VIDPSNGGTDAVGIRRSDRLSSGGTGVKPLDREIVLDIQSKELFAGGHEFGDVGAYERLRGRARLAVDPGAPAVSGILDLALAPRNERGRVEFASDFLILKPLSPTAGNRRLFYDFGNRGNMRSLQYLNDAPASNDPRSIEHAGNGFLFRRGYTVLWSAWQGDMNAGNDRVVLDVPVATEDGQPITGPVLQVYSVSERGISVMPLSGRVDAHSYPAASLDTRTARLTRRRYPASEREPIAAEAWSFARIEKGEGPDDQGGKVGIVPSAGHIFLHEGFEPGWIYELIYTARDPLVLGLGYVALRDLVSHLRYESEDSSGRPNPLGPIDKAYGWGRSQTGRFIRDFVYYGFNADAEGRRVFDGVMPHVSGAGRVQLNRRFANLFAPSGGAYQHRLGYGDNFPFAYAETTDHLTGARDAILKRPETDPLVIHTQTSTEYWQRRGSLVHTDTNGEDLEQPNTVRIYHWASSQHSANPRLTSTAPPASVMNPVNNVYTSPFFRAMLDALDVWASTGAAPPPSRYPSRKAETLVSYARWAAQFPPIRGQMLPDGPLDLPRMDFGPAAAEGWLTRLPPALSDRDGYAVLVPMVDTDGNERGGVVAPMVAVPLGTYTGWNLQKRGFGHGVMSWAAKGSYIPFPETAEERATTGDPRAALRERYRSVDDYLHQIRAAARQLVEDGFLLEEDVEPSVAFARKWWAC